MELKDVNIYARYNNAAGDMQVSVHMFALDKNNGVMIVFRDVRLGTSYVLSADDFLATYFEIKNTDKYID